MSEGLVMTLAMAALYLIVIRFIDVNEKEPLWAVLTFFALGAIAGTVVVFSVDTALVELGGISGTLVLELGRFGAVALGFAALGAAAHAKGYSEVNGLMDGVVYGSAGGLGFATGLAYARSLLISTEWLPVTPTLPGYAELALVGLSDGLFGALMGAGFASAFAATSSGQRMTGPILGFAGAGLAHVLYDVIGRANVYGDTALSRKWLALLLPVFVVGLITYTALKSEKRAIEQELEGEMLTGAVSDEDWALLQSVSARRMLYAKTLLAVDFGRWTLLHELHNRQVQLALTKRRLRMANDETMCERTATELKTLREIITHLKTSLGHEVVRPSWVSEKGIPDEEDSPDDQDSPNGEAAEQEVAS